MSHCNQVLQSAKGNLNLDCSQGYTCLGRIGLTKSMTPSSSLVGERVDFNASIVIHGSELEYSEDKSLIHFSMYSDSWFHITLQVKQNALPRNSLDFWNQQILNKINFRSQEARLHQKLHSPTPNFDVVKFGMVCNRTGSWVVGDALLLIL